MTPFGARPRIRKGMVTSSLSLDCSPVANGDQRELLKSRIMPFFIYLAVTGRDLLNRSPGRHRAIEIFLVDVCKKRPFR